MRLKRQSDSHFPNDKVFERFGVKRELLDRAREYCVNRDDLTDAVSLFPESATLEESETTLRRSSRFPNAGPRSLRSLGPPQVNGSVRRIDSALV
jgi:hypothetical protein